MSDSNAAQGGQTKTWWQWLLIYPTLAISLMGSIPTFYELYSARSMGVEYGTVKQAKQQKDMWQKNMECTAAPFDWLTTPTNTLVDATICRSGDVLVRVKSPDQQQFYRWVPVDSIASDPKTVSFSLFGKVYAATSTAESYDNQSGISVLCQRWVGDGHLLRRIYVPNQGCYDEVVNTYSGAVVSSRPAPCNNQC